MPSMEHSKNRGTSTLVRRALPVLVLAVSLIILMTGAVAADMAYTPSTAWYTDHLSPYTVSTAEDLAGLSQIVASGTDTFAGKTILLGADIQMNTNLKDIKEVLNLKNFASIGPSTETPFEGTFDGQGHTISGLYTTGNGLFFTGNNCVIKNLNIVDSSIVSPNPITGAVIGYSLGDSAIENCHVRDTTVYVTSVGTGDVGGIAGLVVKGYLLGCSVENCTIVCANADYTGGIVGYADDETAFAGCSAKNTVVICGKSGSGGIIGYAFTDVFLNSCTVDTCYIESLYDNYVGGIAGYGGSEATFDNCLVTNSEVKAYKHSVGGIAGYTYRAIFTGIASKVENTVVESEIEEYVGGFIGSTNKPILITVANTRNCELVSSRVVGGIEGYSTNVGILVGRGTISANADPVKISTSIVGNPNAPETTDKTLFNLAGTSYTDNGWIVSTKETEIVNGQVYGTPDKVFVVPEVFSDLNQKETAKTPLPIAGIIAGLGAAAVFLARRH